MAEYLCPVCRAPRDAELKDHISFLAHVRIAFLVGALSLVFRLFGAAPWKAAVFYLPLWAVAEFFHWARMREAAKCRTCDFDPILYRKNPLEARRRVEAKLTQAVDGLKGQLASRSPSARAALKQKAAAVPTAPAPEAPQNTAPKDAKSPEA